MKFSDADLVIFFGLPGCGKTTLAAKLTKYYLKRNRKVYSNVPIIGALEYRASDLGTYDLDNGVVIVDEAGLEFNNRNFKSFSQKQLEFFKLHRHSHNPVFVFSQTYDDMDLKIRSLASKLYYVKRSGIIIQAHRIFKTIGISEDKQIQDQYDFAPWYLRPFNLILCLAPLYWRFFNSYDIPKLPKREWHIYDKEHINK